MGTHGALPRLRGRFDRNRGALPSSGLGARRLVGRKSRRAADHFFEGPYRAGFEPRRGRTTPLVCNARNRASKWVNGTRIHDSNPARLNLSRWRRSARAEIFALPGASRLTIGLASEAALHGLAVRSSGRTPDN